MRMPGCKKFVFVIIVNTIMVMKDGDYDIGDDGDDGDEDHHNHRPGLPRRTRGTPGFS